MGQFGGIFDSDARDHRAATAKMTAHIHRFVEINAGFLKNDRNRRVVNMTLQIKISKARGNGDCRRENRLIQSGAV